MLVDVVAGTRNIKMFILDEADEMLSRGFKDQIYDVFRTLNENIQVFYTICLEFHYTVPTQLNELSLFMFGVLPNGCSSTLPNRR